METTKPAIIVTIDGRTWSETAEMYFRLPHDQGCNPMFHPMTKMGNAGTPYFPPGCWLDGDLLRAGWRPAGIHPHGQPIPAERVTLAYGDQRRDFEIGTGHVLGCLLEGLGRRLYLVVYGGPDGLDVRAVTPLPGSRIKYR